MTDQEREFMELIAERAATRAVDKAVSIMESAINSHSRNCPLGFKFKSLVAWAGVIGTAFGFVINKIFDWIKP